MIIDTGTFLGQFVGPAAGGMLIGGITGYGIKKILRLVFKIALIVLGAFFAGLMIMQARGYLTGINWNKMGEDLYSSMNSTIVHVSHGNYNDAGTQILHNLGIPMTSGIAIGFIIGFIKG